MASLVQTSHRLWLALCLVIGLMVLPIIFAPAFGDELANQIPGTNVVFANESHGGGG